jgi:RNA polymerase sigma-54 factor
MKLELSQKLQQQQILAPQMILSMDILLLPALDLEQRIQQEFAENPALEIVERFAERKPAGEHTAQADKSDPFAALETFRAVPLDYYENRPQRSRDASDAKFEALQNTEGRPPGLKDYLVQQLHLKSLSKSIQDIGENIINNLDHRGYLLHSSEDVRLSIDPPPPAEEFDAALDAVRGLDPPGIGAQNLQECLLLQLERDRQEYPLETEIIRHHLLDLSLNRIPKIAKDLGRTVEEIKEAVEIIASLDPLPGSRHEPHQPIYVRPDVIVEEVDGKLEVRVENQSIPRLQISEACRNLLKASRGNREAKDFVRKKIESAQWLIQAIKQRQRTIYDIAVALVEYQKEFMLQGPERLRAMKMQTIADIVEVHISTISRAIKGKYIQTPWGTFEMRYFFTGGVENQSGELESRRNVYRKIGEIIENEDRSRPLSDSQIARILRQQGLSIARRTVTKYREQEKIPASRLRKAY